MTSNQRLCKARMVDVVNNLILLYCCYEVSATAADCGDENLSTELVNCQLTKYEFASTLGLQVDSMFVTNMFKIIDKNETGLITFRDFLDFFVLLNQSGRPTSTVHQVNYIK